jgi:hypothetical protein
MKETKDDSLFAELTPEESASVNGGHYSIETVTVRRVASCTAGIATAPSE